MTGPTVSSPPGLSALVDTAKALVAGDKGLLANVSRAQEALRRQATSNQDARRGEYPPSKETAVRNHPLTTSDGAMANSSRHTHDEH